LDIKENSEVLYSPEEPDLLEYRNL